MNFDVVVIGGGPAGLAAAIGLGRSGRSVAVLQRDHYDRPRAGETFAGELGPLLRELGAWDDFQALEPTAFLGVTSSWGTEGLTERESIFNPFGAGWHVDRRRFDQCLACCAERQGVRLVIDSGRCVSERVSDGWEVRTASGLAVRSRYLVDASGRGAPATGRLESGHRWLRMDRQIAVLGTLAVATPPEPTLLLEPVEQGWWYSAPQPGGRLLAVLVTDADLFEAGGRAELEQRFLAALNDSTHTRTRAQAAPLCEPPWVARADSGMMIPSKAPGLRAVGDAAMACDPLAGDGVVRALRDGLEAARAIDREFGSTRELSDEFDRMERFRAYLQARSRYYERERRWSDAPFWARRRPIPWQSASLFLEPQRLLRWQAGTLERKPAAEIEALLPPAALRALQASLQEPTPAHTVLSQLRAIAPLEDRRLLVALQLLIVRGCVAAS